MAPARCYFITCVAGPPRLPDHGSFIPRGIFDAIARLSRHTMFLVPTMINTLLAAEA
jgi:hypothetical protein